MTGQRLVYLENKTFLTKKIFKEIKNGVESLKIGCLKTSNIIKSYHLTKTHTKTQAHSNNKFPKMWNKLNIWEDQEFNSW